MQSCSKQDISEKNYREEAHEQKENLGEHNETGNTEEIKESRVYENKENELVKEVKENEEAHEHKENEEVHEHKENEEVNEHKENEEVHEVKEQTKDEIKEEAKIDDKSNENDHKDEDPNKDPEPFEQTEVITEYSMDTLYNKKRVPYIEKNNGTLVLTQSSDYKRAIEYYNKALFAIKILLEDQNLNVGEQYAIKVIEEVEIPVSSNLTLCYLKEKDYHNVIKYANRLLDLEENNVKILYRRGLAYTYLMEFDKGKEDLLKANKLEPNNKQILDGIKIYKEKKHEYKNNTQKLCQKIFDKKNDSLYEDSKKETVDVAEDNNQEGRKSIPLLVWKIAESITNIASPLINIPDHLPCVGGMCKRTKSGAAKMVRNNYFKLFKLQQEKVKEEAKEEAKDHLKKE